MLPGAVGSEQEALDAAKEDELEQLLWQVARGKVSISAAVDFLETEPERDLADKRGTRRWSQQTRMLAKPTPTTLAPAQVIQSKAPQCAQVVVEAYEENDPLCAGCRVRDHQLKALAKALQGLAHAVLSLSGLSLPKQELARLVLDHCSPLSHLEVGLGTLCASLHAAVKDSQRQEPKVFSEASPPSKVTPLRDPSPIAAAELDIGAGALSPTRLPRARPVPPYQDSDRAQFHDLQVSGVEVEVQRSPSSAPAALLRMPELSPQPRPLPPRSPRRAASPYELATRGPHRAEPDRTEDAAGAWIQRSAPKPTQRAEMLFDLPQPWEAPPLLPKPQGRASPHQAPHEAMSAKALRQQAPHEETLPAAEPVAKAHEVPATDATPTDANVSESQPDVALADHGIPAPLPAPSRRESHEVAVAPDKLGTDASGPDRSAPAPKATTLVSADEEGAHLAPAARKTVSLGDLPETQSSADGQAPQKMERQNARSLSVFASLPGYTKEFASSAGLEISPAHISPSAGGKGQATREVENASAEPSAKPPSTDSPAPPGKTAATEPSAKPSNKDAPALHGEPAATEPSAKPPSSDPPAAPGEPTATEPSAKPASKDALLPDGQSASASPEASKTEPALSEPSRKVRKSAPQGGLPADADIADWRKHSSGALSDSARPIPESAPVVAPKTPPAVSAQSPETARASSDAATPKPLQKEEQKEDTASSSESDSSDGSEPSAPPENKSKALHQVEAPTATDSAPAAIRKSLPDRLQEAPRAGSLRMGNGPMRAGSLSFKGTPKAFARP